MTTQTAYAAGQSAARKAISGRRPGRRRMPSIPSALKVKWQAQWEEFVAGWSTAIAEDADQQANSAIVYRNGVEATISPTEEEKMVNIDIYEDRPGSFWRDMGPFFALRQVRREMPYLVDDEGYIWFVARGLQGRVVGFASLHISKLTEGYMHGLYVLDEMRKTGIGNRLIADRIRYLTEHKVSKIFTTANPFSAPILKQHGFQQKSVRGKFERLVLEVDAK
jgi:GNAT superfamily N-acetyltransferase